MASLNNCSITSTSVTVPKGTALTGSVASQVLIITPDDGYVIARSNFSNHTASHAAIESILLADTGTAYAADNTVRVTVDLKDTYTPTAALALIIDIGGSATNIKLIPYSWNGNYTLNGTNITTGDVGSPTSITHDGYVGGAMVYLQELILTASTNYHFEAAPTIVISGHSPYQSNYGVTVTPVASNANGQFTSYSCKVLYQFPSASVSGVLFAWTAPAVATPATPDNIVEESHDSNTVDAAGAEKSIKIYGTKSTSKFELKITRASDSYTYNFTTGLFASGTNTYNASGTAVGSSLVYEINGIVLPANASGATYNAKITAVSPTSAASTLNNYNNVNPTFSWTQAATTSLVITANSPVKTLTKTYANNSITFTVNQEEEEDPLYSLGSFQITAVNPSGAALQLRRSAVFSNTTAYDTAGNNDFTNTIPASNNGTDFNITNLTTAGDNTATITITGDYLQIWEAGSAGVASVLNLDNIINQAPTSNALAVNVDYETAVTFSLSGSDPESDTLTYATVGSPSNGAVSSLNTATGAITYTPNSSFSGTDTFTYKVNDTHEDSNTATVTLTVAGSGGSSVARYSLETYNSGGYVTGVHYIDGTQVCESGSLTGSVCLGFGSLTNKWFRYVTVAGGCGSTVYGRGKLIGATSAGVPTAYINENTYYNNMADSQSDTNGVSC